MVGQDQGDEGDSDIKSDEQLVLGDLRSHGIQNFVLAQKQEYCVRTSLNKKPDAQNT